MPNEKEIPQIPVHLLQEDARPSGPKEWAMLIRFLLETGETQRALSRAQEYVNESNTTWSLLLRSEVMIHMGDTASAREDLQGALSTIPIIPPVIEILKRISSPLVARTIWDCARELIALGEAERVIPLLSIAQEMFDNHCGIYHIDSISVVVELAVEHEYAGQKAESVGLYKDAIARSMQTNDLPPNFYPDLLERYGVLLYRLNRFSEAEDVLSEAVKRFRLHRPRFDKDLASSSASLAYVKDSLHKHDEAVSLMDEAIDVGKIAYHGYNTKVLRYLHSSASFYGKVGKLQIALDRLMEIDRQIQAAETNFELTVPEIDLLKDDILRFQELLDER